MPRGLSNSILTHTLTADEHRRGPDEVAVEEPLEIRLDGNLVGTTMRTPGNDFELAAGFCHTEGLLDGAAVRSVKYCRGEGPGAGARAARRDEGATRAASVEDLPRSSPPGRSWLESEFNVVTVSTGGRAPVPEPRLSTTTSACGMCGTTAVDELRARIYPLPVGVPFAQDLLLDAPSRLLDGAVLFASTGAVHAAALMDRDGDLVVLREDVGRHNAVDKVVGERLLAGMVPAPELALVVSGRIGFEIVQKAWAAGVTTVVAKGAPTSLAVEAARVARITLVGWADGQRARLYNGELA